MQDGLLAANTMLIIVIVAFGVMLALAAIYGVFRKFYRTSWLGWQIPLIFPVVFVCGALEGKLSGIAGTAVAAAIFLVWAGLVLGAGGVVRYCILSRIRPGGKGARVMNRIFGAVTSVVNVAVFFFVVVLFALSLLKYVLPETPAQLEPVYTHPIWAVLDGFALDVMIIALLSLGIRMGFRVGLGRALFATLMLALTLGSVVLALYFPVGVRFSGKTFAGALGKMFKKANPVVAFLAGYGIAAFIVFAVSFAVTVLLGVLINFIVRKVRYNSVFGIVDGLLLSVIFYVFLIALGCAVSLAVAYFADYGAELLESLPIEGIAEEVSDVFGRIRAFLLSAPLSRFFYENNPALSLLG